MRMYRLREKRWVFYWLFLFSQFQLPGVAPCQYEVRAEEIQNLLLLVGKIGFAPLQDKA